MTKDERSLLLFLECRATDHGGRINSINMNQDDIKTAQQWNFEGFLKFGRIASDDLSEYGNHWCFLSDEAWQLAHAERKARSARLWEGRQWKTTEEKSHQEDAA